MAFGLVRFEQPRRHHRGQGQRHEGRDRDGHRQHDGELAEQPPDDPAHQEKRDQHRDQRDRDRHDGEADLARPLERGLHGPHPLLDVAADVLQHDDGIVDHEAHRDGQGHQREVVEGVARDPHQCAGAQKRQGHRHARDHGRPEAAQEHEDHADDQRDRQYEGELHVLHGGADRLRPVAEDADLDGGRQGGGQAWQLVLDTVHRVDDVGAGLLEHHQEDATPPVRPARLLGVLGAGDRLPDVPHAERRPVAIGDDDVVPVLRRGELVVGVDGVAVAAAVDAALRVVDGGEGELGAHVLQGQALGHELGGIDLDPDRRLLLAADEHLGDAGDLADALGELHVDRVIHVDQRQAVGGGREQ
ncbi:hypothetical protein KHHGKMAE_0159 [Methylobacterium persicinum]|nr:hypothetical protein KHHGKMAE_0159 [Methylobacterium persicinum]